MKRSRSLRLVMKLTALLAWSAFAFWLFRFSFSSSFFRYNLASRLPPFAAAFAGAVALPISAHHQWRRQLHFRASCLAGGPIRVSEVSKCVCRPPL